MMRFSLAILYISCGVLTAADIAAQTGEIETVEVVVTTGFRPEALSDRAGSVSVIDSASIEAREALHLESVVGAAANVTMTSGASRGRFIQVRGIGDLEQFVDPKHYPSVGLSLDGIDVGGVASAAMLYDIDQVEVLRGPQGTRFGATALAGQVNIVSAAPSDSFESSLELGAGNYGAGVLGFVASGPMTDALAGRVALQHHEGDGYMENLWLGRDDTNGYDESMFRARLQWAATDSMVLDVTALRFDSDNGYDAFSLDNNRQTLSDEPGRDDLDLTALGLKAGWVLDSGGSIEANLNWLDSRVDYGFDEDWTYVGICDGTLCDPVLDFFSNTDRYIREREDRSLDLRWLSSPTDGGLSYVIGLYVHDRVEDLARQYYGPFASNYAADRMALYGQVEFPLTNRIDMTLGYRHERFDDEYVDSFAFESRSKDDIDSGELSLRYALGERSSLYAVISRGSKPGGVNTEASSVMPFVQPRFQEFLASRLSFSAERLVNLELGLSTELAGGRAALRAAAFRMTRDRAQLESWFWDPENFLWVGILDGADGENLGAEIDVEYRVTGVWTISASLGLLDSDVSSLTTFDLDRDDFVVRSGIDQTKSPSWQAHVASRWQFDNGWHASVDVDATDAQRYGYYHDAKIGGSNLLHASVGRRFSSTEVTLWVRNVLDEDVAVHGLYFQNDPRKGWIPERYLQLGEPRLIGAQVRFEF